MSSSTDRALVARINRATIGSRALLCTLARLGKAMRRDEPARAEAWLLAMQGHPLYKGGRLAFDLLELDDLMMDGPPPDAVDSAELRRSLAAVIAAFTNLFDALGKFAADVTAGRVDADEPPPETPASEEEPVDLPALDTADYLFDLLMLGVLGEVSRPSRPASHGN